ncbi:hypothetical protein ACJJTC_000768 [Scirpophaga incertulas]
MRQNKINGTSGIVAVDHVATEERGALTFYTPIEDPVVVIARCTRFMLENRILEMAKTVSGSWITEPWEGGREYVPSTEKNYLKYEKENSTAESSSTLECSNDEKNKFTYIDGASLLIYRNKQTEV